MHPSEMTQEDIDAMFEASIRRMERLLEYDRFLSGKSDINISFSDAQEAMITTVPVTQFD